MSFIVINNFFECEWCGEKNFPAKSTCRNHCKSCFSSKHVDLDFPGDRKSECFGRMIVKHVIPHNSKEWILIHECTKCKKVIKNKIAEDDDIDNLIDIIKLKNIN
jgi:hypothetical protein